MKSKILYLENRKKLFIKKIVQNFLTSLLFYQFSNLYLLIKKKLFSFLIKNILLNNIFF